MADHETEYSLELKGVERWPLRANVERVSLHTSGGDIGGVLHLGQANQMGCVVWVGGAGGGLDGPAMGLYPRLSEQLAQEGFTSLRLDYRAPNDFVPCVLDTMIGVVFLEGLDCDRAVLVGHSFGGAVVITAGALSQPVVGVAALSSQTAGTELAQDLGDRSLFLAHGSADRVLPDNCSRDIYQRVGGPKQLRLYPGCGHGLDECRQQLEQDLLSWLHEIFQPGPPSNA